MNFEKMAALGAMGVAGGAMLAWLGLVWVLRPVPTGGIDSVSHVAVAAATFVPLAMIALVHAWLGVQLGRGPRSIRG